MKTFEATGNIFCISPALKKLACRGSSNSETVRFKLDRCAGETDLFGCNCTVKTRNSDGISDLAVPKLTADGQKLNVYWTLSSGATAAAEPLFVQIQFEKIFDDKSENVNWQSNIMEFEISESLDADDEITDREPTLFQQWEEKVNTTYSDVSASVQSVQALQNQVQADADTVAQQKQSVEQTAAQVTQDAQSASESAQNAAASVTAAQTSAQQAQASAADAQTAQGLAKGYSDAAKTYSDAAAVSAQAAQRQADTAQEAAAQAQQKVDAFSGYTKTEIDDGFACALIGEASGQSVALDDVQPNTNFRSLTIYGQTVQDGSGDPSPENVRPLRGTTSLTVADGAGQQQAIALPQALYGLSGAADGYDMVSGQGTLKIKKIMLNGTEDLNIHSGAYDGATFAFRTIFDLPKGGEETLLCDRFLPYDKGVLFKGNAEGCAISTTSSTYLVIRILKSRLSGWSDGWTSQQKIDAFKVWLQGSPLTMLYKLAAPAAVQGPAPTVPSYAPGSVLSPDCGSLSVRYCRDLTAVIKGIEESMQAPA